MNMQQYSSKNAADFEIVGIDGGNNRVKAFGKKGPMKFLSNLGEWRDRNLRSTHGTDDMEYEYQKKMKEGEYKILKGFAGTLAKFESEYDGAMPGDTKAHDDHLIRVLLALHRYSDGVNFKIVVGQPIEMHTEDEKQRIREMLIGNHEFTVNGKKRCINILEAEVAAEGGAAFWSNPQKGTVRILDFGGGTVNAATLTDGRYIDKDSFTHLSGMDTNKTTDTKAMARAVAAKALKKWKRTDNVKTAGGPAIEMVGPLSDYFYNVGVLYPKAPGNQIDEWSDLQQMIQSGDIVQTEQGQIKGLHPIYGNAVGNYNIAKGMFE